MDIEYNRTMPIAHNALHTLQYNLHKSPFNDLKGTRDTMIRVIHIACTVHLPVCSSQFTDQRLPVSLKEGSRWYGDSSSSSYVIPLLSREMLVRKVKALPM